MEFAIVVPLLLLLLCGTIDFGLIFGGYQSMQSGVASSARALSLNEYQYTSSTSKCLYGPDTQTANAVCNVVATLGPLTGMNTSTLEVGICFVPPGSTPSCSGQTGPGTSVSDDVLVCVQANMASTTGLTSILVSSSTVSTSSRVLQEQPQPAGPTAFGAYNAKSSSQVQYNGTKIPGMTCT